jgi:hypothetical protein
MPNRTDGTQKQPLDLECTGADRALSEALNAVAALCVCEPRHHRAAVSLVHRKECLVLHVAQSSGDDVGADIASMVEDVWRLLVDFANVIGGPDTRSAKGKIRGHEAQRRVLERLVHHGVRRLRYRVLKHWEFFQDVCIRLQTEKVKHGKVYKDFFAVALRVAELKESLISSEPPDWGKVVAPQLGRLFLALQQSSVRTPDALHQFISQLDVTPDGEHHQVFSSVPLTQSFREPACIALPIKVSLKMHCHSRQRQCNHEARFLAEPFPYFQHASFLGGACSLSN